MNSSDIHIPSIPNLRFFASLWTLVDYPSAADAEWTVEEKLSAIRNAGFHGFQWGAEDRFLELAARHSLTFLGTCQPKSDNYVDCVRAFAGSRPARINVQLGSHDTPPSEAARMWGEMVAVASDLGLHLDLETHRGTCTETPEKTAEIIGRYEQKHGVPLQLTLDFSHFAVVKHLEPPYDALLDAWRPSLRVCRQMHLRPFNGHHCQIPATNSDGGLSERATPWLDFVVHVLSAWREVNAETVEPLWVCPEFGGKTSGYFLPDFPDPWLDTCFVASRLGLLRARGGNSRNASE